MISNLDVCRGYFWVHFQLVRRVVNSSSFLLLPELLQQQRSLFSLSPSLVALNDLDCLGFGCDYFVVGAVSVFRSPAGRRAAFTCLIVLLKNAVLQELVCYVRALRFLFCNNVHFNKSNNQSINQSKSINRSINYPITQYRQSTMQACSPMRHTSFIQSIHQTAATLVSYSEQGIIYKTTHTHGNRSSRLLWVDPHGNTLLRAVLLIVPSDLYPPRFTLLLAYGAASSNNII